MFFYQLSDFPQLTELVENWKIIKEEASRLDDYNLNINRVDKDHEVVAEEILEKIKLNKKNGWVDGWNNKGEINKNWIQYGLIINDQEIPYSNMPKTIKLLKKIKGIKVAALNILKSESILGTHTHPEMITEKLAQMHISLDAPEPKQSYLCINGDFFEHKTGNYAIFNGAYPHFAINAGKKDRMILYLEFKRNKL